MNAVAVGFFVVERADRGRVAAIGTDDDVPICGAGSDKAGVIDRERRGAKIRVALMKHGGVFADGGVGRHLSDVGAEGDDGVVDDLDVVGAPEALQHHLLAAGDGLLQQGGALKLVEEAVAHDEETVVASEGDIAGAPAVLQGNAVVVVDVDVGRAALGKAAHHRSVAKVVHVEGVDLVVADQQPPLVGLTGRVVVVDNLSLSLSLSLSVSLSLSLSLHGDRSDVVGGIDFQQVEAQVRQLP